MKKLLALILALVMCFSLVACGGDKTDDAAKPAESAKPSATNQIVENTQKEVTKVDETVEYEETVYTCDSNFDSADPYAVTSSPNKCRTNMTFDVVTHLNLDTGVLEPELAKSWENNADSTVWTFYLEENVTFHNGNKFTADDIKFTWEYAGAGQGNVAKPITAYTWCKEINVIDDYTIEFVLNMSVPDFDFYMEQKIYDKESFDALPVEEAGIIGTGPYYYDTELSTPGGDYVFTRYDNHWRGIEQYPTKHFYFKTITDVNARAAALETGEIDFTVLTAATYPTVENNPDLEMYSRPGVTSYFLGFNYANPIFQDVEVRRAIGMAINREDIIAAAFRGGLGASLSKNFVVPSGQGYNAGATPLAYDVEAAKAVLEPLNLELHLIHWGMSGVPEVIQDNLGKVGVKITVERKDSSNWSAIKASQEGYDLWLDYASYTGAILYTPNRLLNSAGSSNVYGFYSAEYEQLEANVNNAATYEEMVAEFQVLQDWIIENVPLFPFAVGNILAGAQADVEGLYYSPSPDHHDYSTVRIPKRG